MAASFARLRAAAIDGRLHNPIYRKAQLKKLHDALVDNAHQLQDAILRDTGYRLAEVKIEHSLALQYLIDAFASIDPQKLFEEEYAPANGNDAPSASVPVGIVVIEPAAHAFLSSLVSALAPALAAGNCILVKAQANLLGSPRFVLEVISGALDSDVFAHTFDTIDEAAVGGDHCRVLQAGIYTSVAGAKLASDSEAHVVAIVERDADLKLAAKTLVEARYTLRGKSPYGPDVVLVNEWIKKDLISALLQQSVQLEPVGDATQQAGKKKRSGSFLQKLEKDGSADVVSSSSLGAVVVAENRKLLTESPKLKEPCLLLHSITSIDDAIDVSKALGHVAALYTFTSSLPTAKYISQFVNAGISFVNQIPRSIHYGPIAPETHPWSPQARSCYVQGQFTRPCPLYVTLPSDEPMFEGMPLNASPHQLTILDAKYGAKLPDVKRGMGPRVGFFEQGILVSSSLTATLALSCVGTMGYTIWRRYF